MSREWTERHIRELIEDELKNVKSGSVRVEFPSFSITTANFTNDYMDKTVIRYIDFDPKTLIGKCTITDLPDVTDMRYSTNPEMYAGYDSSTQNKYLFTVGWLHTYASGAPQYYDALPIFTLNGVKYRLSKARLVQEKDGVTTKYNLDMSIYWRDGFSRSFNVSSTETHKVNFLFSVLRLYGNGTLNNYDFSLGVNNYEFEYVIV